MESPWIYPFEIDADPLATLAVADPDLAAEVSRRLGRRAGPVRTEKLVLLVRETLSAMSREIAFGRAVAEGMADIIAAADPAALDRYCRMVGEAGQKGSTLGRAMATYLVPVLIHGNGRLLTLFSKAVDIMLEKGTYTLKDPLEALSRMLDAGDRRSAATYLKLLCDTFSREISYNQCQHLTREIPRSIRRMAPGKRAWQIEQMRRIVRSDVHLIESFMAGMGRGLEMLAPEALERFVDRALAKADRRDARPGMRFLALESGIALDTLSGLQVTASLSQVRGRMNRYVRARIGQSMSTRPLSALGKSFFPASETEPAVCSDVRFVYLPEEIDRYPAKDANVRLYAILTKLEAGIIEFGTYDFDLEKARVRHPAVEALIEPDAPNSDPPPNRDRSDLERFFGLFPDCGLAADLFTLFEHGRMIKQMSVKYPGLLKTATPMLAAEAEEIGLLNPGGHPLSPLYAGIALNLPFGGETKKGNSRAIGRIIDDFHRAVSEDPSVETSAALTARTYWTAPQLIETAGVSKEGAYPRLPIPFGRRIRPDIAYASVLGHDRTAARIKERLAARGIRVFKSDLVRKLVRQRGRVSGDDILALVRKRGDSPGADAALSGLDLSSLLDPITSDPATEPGDRGDVFWYREWDSRLGDYLPDHVRIREQTMEVTDNGFYDETLKKHEPMVKTIRHGFERMKPEGLAYLRRWIEGDEFDYRAMLDFAIDKKIGRTPSERLYTKRIKQVRDVAVMLLLDLSRSTANAVAGGNGSVLEVEKEALVLFCEALQVVGDRFAIAGFSGNGRLGVDFYRIKDFGESVDETVHSRIGVLSPRRNTRMGAAIRHATALFESVPAKVRLMLILGDGFPNDTDYKRSYAVEDTRRAIREAASLDLHVHGITVNIGIDAGLDDLFGRIRHSVITDVQDLPDKLPAIYGALTRN